MNLLDWGEVIICNKIIAISTITPDVKTKNLQLFDLIKKLSLLHFQQALSFRLS